jgi:hypothetical protein
MSSSSPASATGLVVPTEPIQRLRLERAPRNEARVTLPTGVELEDVGVGECLLGAPLREQHPHQHPIEEDRVARAGRR